MTQNQPEDRFATSVELALNMHGYAFHFTMLKRTATLAAANFSPWRPIAYEFPVELRGATTRIDFVLRHRELPRYMVVECKRVDPALSNWVFARSPWVSGNPSAEALLVEALTVLPDIGRCTVARRLTFRNDLASVALEVKSNAKGDGTGKRGTVEEVCSQLMRGHNGLIRHFNERHPPGHNEAIEFVPVVVTTARLFFTETDLGGADLERGHVAVTAEPSERPWILYQYHQSPGLKHGLPSWSKHSGVHALDQDLYSDFVRTICFVSASHFAEFFAWQYWGMRAD